MSYEYEIYYTGENYFTMFTNPELEYMVGSIVDYIDNSFIENKKWQNKNIKDIVYDRRPYNTDSYDLIMDIKFSKAIYMDWFEYLLKIEIDKRKELDLLFENSNIEMEDKVNVD